MKKSYIIGIDQSTQGTKALLFDASGALIARADKSHKQMINEQGWVSHDAQEIYENTIAVVKDLLKQSGVAPEEVAGIGLTNQRETSILWDRATGEPLNNAIVWQCARATSICEREQIASKADMIFAKTGLKLSPYFPAAKIAWLLENTPNDSNVCHGTVDAYLVYRLTEGKVYATDYSNASRTQLFDIFALKWDKEICSLFGIDPKNLPEVKDSDGNFGETTMEGIFPQGVPIAAVMGDSHGALFGQQCHSKGMTKATYGTGSSIMMNIGKEPVLSNNGLVTSLAWSRKGQVEYVLEGNLNYTGAVITWLKDDMKLISSPGETEELAKAAVQEDSLYLVPAFTGLGAPYWNSSAKAMICGMDRTTGRNEIVRAALESIAYQITDVLKAMQQDCKGLELAELRVDGGPTGNAYLMQFQSDISAMKVQVSSAQELSGIGVAYMAGMSLGLWDENVFSQIGRTSFAPTMEEEVRDKKYQGWKAAVEKVLNNG